MGYNLNPSPTNYSSAYGGNVGTIAAPPSIWEQLQQNVPDYANLVSSANNEVQSQLNGELSSGTMRNLENYAASRGVAMGQPNSAISNLIGLNAIGTTSENLTNQGIGNFQNLSNLYGSQQENPSLLASIAEENAVNRAAPNPEAAARQLQQNYQSQQQMNYLLANSSFGKPEQYFPGTGTESGHFGVMDDWNSPQQSSYTGASQSSGGSGGYSGGSSESGTSGGNLSDYYSTLSPASGSSSLLSGLSSLWMPYGTSLLGNALSPSN
jgi:hypothetical protein